MLEQNESPIDRALSDFLTRRSGLDGKDKQIFATVIRSLSGALRDGHICLELDEKEQEIIEQSRLISAGADLPLVLSGSRLYLARYYSYESRLVENLTRLSAFSYQIADVERLLDLSFPATSAIPDTPDYQRQAARLALNRSLTIIAGGPGTGKTTAIVKIVGLLLDLFGSDLRIALAAPTGKAAIRMRESISSLVPILPFKDDVREAFPLEAVTLHRLLGSSRFGTNFRHDRKNPLPWDVVLVDEASMVDLAMMSKLVDALKENSRLILLGDKDQLSSVESGSVLGDTIAALPGNVVKLQKSYRFEQDISDFAGTINRGDAEGVWDIVEAGASSSIKRADDGWLDQAAEIHGHYMKQALKATGIDDYPKLFELFHSFQVLCALRNGPRGVNGINTQVELRLAQQGFGCGIQQWYLGRPVIITSNDYPKELFNGDVGLCLPDPQRGGEPAVWFEKTDGGLRRYPPARLPSCETVWAMTIHKSQGSEFDDVLIVLPDKDNQVLSRELLYTAVTRARKNVTISGEKEICSLAVTRKTRRSSGLADRLTAACTTQEGCNSDRLY